MRGVTALYGTGETFSAKNKAIQCLIHQTLVQGSASAGQGAGYDELIERYNKIRLYRCLFRRYLKR